MVLRHQKLCKDAVLPDRFFWFIQGSITAFSFKGINDWKERLSIFQIIRQHLRLDDLGGKSSGNTANPQTQVLSNADVIYQIVVGVLVLFNKEAFVFWVFFSRSTTTKYFSDGKKISAFHFLKFFFFLKIASQVFFRFFFLGFSCFKLRRVFR